MSDGGISLYFTLKEGEKADLEVVAIAALEWLAAARAAAAEIEPGAQIRVELIDADESSLRLNAILGWLEGQLERIEEGSGQYPRLRKLAIALAIFVVVTGVETAIDYFDGPPTAALSEEDRQFLQENRRLLNELLERTRKNPEVEVRRQKFFRTLERDQSITGAGISEGPEAAPLVLIPSNQFAERGGLWALATEEPDERTVYPIIDVTLIAPVLLPVPRSWVFQPIDGLPEFRATMRDKRFLAALEHAHVRESLRTGIPMTLRLQIKEKYVSGVWMVKRRGRSVAEVISPKVD
ncbi:MAG: hypothetical protein H3C55_12555 [Pseudorhodoplanes sp.]|nr:hypothetical protein [Pseudorhodoplanes sp.]